MSNVIEFGDDALRQREQEPDGDQWIRKRAVEIVAQLPDQEAEGLRILRWANFLYRMISNPPKLS